MDQAVVSNQRCSIKQASRLCLMNLIYIITWDVTQKRAVADAEICLCSLEQQLGMADICSAKFIYVC